MKELIKIENKIIGSKTVNSVNARELYETLAIKKDFADWAKAQINSLGLEENVDYITFNQKVKAGSGTSIRKEYIFIFKAAKHISMASRTAKGKDVRNYFIKCEEEFLQLPRANNTEVEELKKIIMAQNRLIASSPNDAKKDLKIKQLEKKLLIMETNLDKKVDYRLKAKALYPVILNRIDQIEDELVKEFNGKTLDVYAQKLDEIKLLLSREAKVCKYMTFLGNGTAINNTIIEDDTKKISLK